MPTSSTNPPGRRSRARRRLRLASPPPSTPGDRAKVAKALLGPVEQVVDNGMLSFLGLDGIEELLDDPCFLTGRLSQALTMLLRKDFPRMNSAEELLTEAIRDAIAYRMQLCPRCQPESLCADCLASCNRAARYEWLWNELGLISELPRRPELRDVSS